MKTNSRIWFCALSVICLVLILANSCKKEDEDITDVDGNVYTSVSIGTQVWMVENLKTTRYRNGDLIGTTTPATFDISAEAAPKYQWAYAGFEDNVFRYGRLYTWWAVTDIRGVCPTGWHVPSDAEWTTLTTFLGGEDVAGGKLKEAGPTHWWAPPPAHEGATNSSGFTALPGGDRYPNGSFDGIGGYGNWWSSTEYSATTACCRGMNFYLNTAFNFSSNEQWGLSVRCLRD